MALAFVGPVIPDRTVHHAPVVPQRDVVLLPPEDLGSVNVADRGLLRSHSLFVGLAAQVVGEFLVSDLAYRKTVLGLVRLASLDLAVSDVGRRMNAVFLREHELQTVVPLAVAEVLLPMLAELGKFLGSFLELAVELLAFGDELLLL